MPFFILRKNNYFFNKSRISFNKTSSFVGAGAAAGASSFFFFAEFSPLINKNTAKATIKKSNVTYKKFP